MIAYKGTDKDMQCRGVQYALGCTYEEHDVALCIKGFHACTNPLDVFAYYPPGHGSRYFEVELGGNIDDSNVEDSAVAASKITFLRELTISDLAAEHLRMVANRGKGSKAGRNGVATAGECGVAAAGDFGSATSGECGVATAGHHGVATAGECGVATSGECGVATAGHHGVATAGECGVATAGHHGVATSGDFSSATAGHHGAATAGECGVATAGDFGVATAGDDGSAKAGDFGVATAGYFGSATSGDRGSATAGCNGSAKAGDFGVAAAWGRVSVGRGGCGLVRGRGVAIRGGLGAVLVIAVEQQDSCDLKEWASVVVDGETVKADTWYRLEGGALVEVDA